MLTLHILAGFVGLVVAPGALLTRKGSTWHRRWGWMYATSMALVGSTAIVLAFAPLNLFLLLIGIFSLYMTYSGVRFIRQRRQRAIRAVDWLVASIVTLCCGALAVYGAIDLLRGTSFGIVALAFGGLGTGLAASDLAFYRQPDFSPSTIYQRHLRLMIGSYIAMVSAFSAVNLLFLPPVIRWLWPTVLGSALIALWSRRVAKRFASRKKMTAANPILDRSEAEAPE